MKHTATPGFEATKKPPPQRRLVSFGLDEFGVYPTGDTRMPARFSPEQRYRAKRINTCAVSTRRNITTG